jgi:hypothetical protein
MIIENNNNENNNENNNQFLLTFKKLKYITKKLLFFLFMFMMMLLLYYHSYIYFKEIIHIKKEKFDEEKDLTEWVEDQSFIYRRTLFDLNKTDIVNTLNENINKEDIDTIIEVVKKKFNGDYSFILNVTSNDYIGNWSNLSIIGNYFFEKKIDEGIAELFFHRIKNRNNLVLGLINTKTNSFRIDTILREGKYIDNYIKINSTFFLYDDIEKLLEEKEQLILYNNNTKIDYAKVHFLGDRAKERIDKGNVKLILEKEAYNYAISFRKRIMSQFYRVKLIINSNKLNVTINAIISNNEDLRQKVRIYSFILSIFGLFEIYHILHLIMKINDNNEYGNKLSILSITINCYFKVLICIVHFFLSISTLDEDMSYQFGVPTIIYFFGFTGFELKLLLLVFRTRNDNNINQVIYRKRLLCLYVFFYVSLSLMVLNIRECLKNYYLILTIYIFSWLSQILFSIITNTRPPMSRMYIICLSMSKLFLPIYLKAFDGNIFDLKPSYFKVYLIVIIIIAEIIVLLLQKSFGARTILPKKYRKRGFDYYKDKVNIEMHVSKNPNCVICLESLMVEVDENFNTIQKKEKTKKSCNKIIHLCFLDRVTRKIKRWIDNMEGKTRKKKYMITPCDHVFHTVCLEKWMRQKNECPYCKGVIPPIE